MAHRDIWESYAKAWTMQDPSERTRALADTVHEDCIYTDPTTRAEGWPALLAYMEAFQTQMPGGGFETQAFVDHHDRSMTSWKMVTGEGVVVGTGTSFGTYAEDGRLLTMTGFFEVP